MQSLIGLLIECFWEVVFCPDLLFDTSVKSGGKVHILTTRNRILVFCNTWNELTTLESRITMNGIYLIDNMDQAFELVCYFFTIVAVVISYLLSFRG